jgi:hypothetical protein
MIRYYTLLFIVAIFCSCETVIDVPLKDADQRLVIEGTITNDSNYCVIKISQVSNFYSSNSFNAVSNANVKIIENGSAEYTFLEVAPGIYKLNGFVGAIGANYQLNVTADGKQYIANSKMPAQVGIDSLSVKDDFFFGDTSKVVTCHFQDPVDNVNYYRYKSFFIDSTGKDINIDRDQFFNGEYIDRDLFSISGDFEEKYGDSATIELWSIDASVFDYFYTLSATLSAGSGQFAAPANPNTNISNGAMGFFSAHAISRKGIKLVP